MKDTLQVLGIAGSLRKDSFNKALLKAAKLLVPLNMEINIYSLSDIPLYNEDFRSIEEPLSVKKLKDNIRASDGLLIATPEYNYSIPGVLKNAIDWISRPPADSPLNNKPLAIMGATGGISGTVRAQLHLRQVAVFTNMITMNRPEILIQKANEKFDKDGNLIDAVTNEHIKKFLVSFAEWIHRVSIK
jgi:chromate reductase